MKLSCMLSGRGRGYNPISTIFALSVGVLKGFVQSELGYCSFSGLKDSYVH